MFAIKTILAQHQAAFPQTPHTACGPFRAASWIFCSKNSSQATLFDFPRTKAIGQHNTRWWCQIFFIFTPIWGRFPFWLMIIVQSGWTTNQNIFFVVVISSIYFSWSNWIATSQEFWAPKRQLRFQEISLFTEKSRLVKCYNLARCLLFLGVFFFFELNCPWSWRINTSYP